MWNYLFGISFLSLISYVLWLAYRDPTKNRLTRFVHAYFDRLHPRTGGRPYILLNVIIVLLIAFVMLGYLQ
jgi:hypothetical protein